MNLTPSLILAVALAIASQEPTVAADHAHLNAGAAGLKQGDKLTFDNGTDFQTTSAYVKTLTFTNAATYAGYYQGNITLTALAQTPANAGPVPNAPAPGSFIQARLVSVQGPVGGAFAFWESGATNPTSSLGNGEGSTNLWPLTESDGSPGSDPYGHIHGRRFTATKPGIYRVSLQLLDTSTNGLGGGPIHSPSDALTVYFEADVNIQSLEPDEEHSHVRSPRHSEATGNWKSPKRSARRLHGRPSAHPWLETISSTKSRTTTRSRDKDTIELKRFPRSPRPFGMEFRLQAVPRPSLRVSTPPSGGPHGGIVLFSPGPPQGCLTAGLRALTMRPSFLSGVQRSSPLESADQQECASYWRRR